MEPYEWEVGTPIHPESEGKECSASATIDPGEISLKAIVEVRQALDGGSLGVRALEYIDEYGLSSTNVREAKSRSRSEQEFVRW
jgi:hypothetical protein